MAASDSRRLSTRLRSRLARALAGPSAAVPAAHLCSACASACATFGPGPGGRPSASCPRCGSLERHRFLALLLEGLAPAVASARLVVDVAPSPASTRILRRLAPARYARIDLDRAADRRAIDACASLTALPLRTASTDLLVCFHVLEHVPDDAAALAELRRVLAWGGLALVQVPWRPDAPTDEDPSAPEPERVRRFGQADHVRLYGADFESRIERAGLRSLRVTPQAMLGAHAVELFRLLPEEAVWIVRRSDGSRRRAFDPGSLRPATLTALIESRQLRS